MEMSELIKNLLYNEILLHASYLALVVLLYVNMRKSFNRSSHRKEKALDHVYIGCALMVISNCVWSIVSFVGNPSGTAAYIINLVYFISSSSAAVCWFVFCTRNLDLKIAKNMKLRACVLVSYDIMLILYMLSPWFGFIFSIENGAYVRGNLFFLDPLTKMVYIALACILAITSGRKRELPYLKKRDYDFALFGLPVLLCGILQIVIGMDFNCLGITAALVLIYIAGITNPDSENLDAIYSLANSFEASYIVNIDTGMMRPLHQDVMHDQDMNGMESMKYSIRFNNVLSEILLPEDRIDTLEAFELDNVAKRFQIDRAFTVRYRTREKSGNTAIHAASFIRAMGEEGKREFLLGINAVHTDSLLYERNEKLSSENAKLEEINAGIMESVAKIVEARDSDSGEHVVRVRKLSEILAKEVMKDYPEYELDEERVKLIASASVLHDVGKIVIPDAVLLKPGRLNKEEFEIMKTHSAKGCDILNLFPLGLDDAFLECALSICRWHHEKYDGKGYPDGLKGEEIPIAAQIVSFADCFDALVSDRPYKKAFAPEKALEMIVDGECGVFSPKILDAATKQKNRLMELARLYAESNTKV